MFRASTTQKWPAGRPAFTRLDLLAMGAIVALVGCLALAALSALRSKQALKICESNLRQVNRALLLFSTDHQGLLPERARADTGELWWWYKEKVKGYAGLTGPSSPSDSVFACPRDRGYSDPQPFCRSPRFDYGSYVFNGVDTLGVPNIAGQSVASLRRPAQTLLVMEWTAHAPLSWHWSRTGRANAPFYCDARSVAGFVDGHVAFTRMYYDGYNAAYTRDPAPGYDYTFSGK